MNVYRQIIIEAPSEAEDVLCGLCFAAGADGVEIDDPALIARHLVYGDWDASVYDGQEIATGRVTLRALWPPGADLSGFYATYTAFTAGCEQQFHLSETPLPECDWQQQWRDNFPSLHLTERLWVQPYWRDVPDEPGCATLLVAPGMAFGTGDHATTALAARLLERYIYAGARVLDLGTGSGILAIAAHKLGAGRLLAVDVDELCRASVAQHRRLNNLAEATLPLLIGDVLQDAGLRWACNHFQADLVVSNIISKVLCELAPYTAAMLRPGGRWLLSGILAEKQPLVRAALTAAHWRIDCHMQEGEWLAFACSREE